MMKLLSYKSLLIKLFSGFVIVFFSSLYLSAQLNYNYSISKTEAVNWFEFEPDEEFFLEGSSRFLKDASTLKYYSSVANFFNFYDNSENSLGVKLSWERLGNHFADIVPKSIQENPFAYPVRELDSMSIWVWSPGNKHELAAIFRREDGFIYSLKLSTLDFKGWKKVKVKVPISIKHKLSATDVSKRYFFDRLRIYTSAEDRVGDIYVFLDKLDVVQELYTQLYDGLEIEEILRQEKREAENSKSSQNSEDKSTETSNSN